MSALGREFLAFAENYWRRVRNNVTKFGAPGNRTPLKKLGRNVMATYECSKCGMSVNATCGKCNEQLVNDTLKLEDGSKVQISKCPSDHGKIKSPLCCGQDMVCSN